MTTNNEAFEKLALENEMDIESLNPDGSYANIETESAWLWFQDGLRIATTEANKRIAELEVQLQNWKDFSKKVQKIDFNDYLELQASNNRLRDGIAEIAVEAQDTYTNAALTKLISATPAESLQAFENEVIEKCAKVCDKWIGLETVAEVIRSLKEVK